MSFNNISINIETALPEQLELWASQHRLSLNEKTVLQALQSVLLFLNEQDLTHVQSNLEDAAKYASPRLRSMKVSTQGHIPYVRSSSVTRQKQWAHEHFAAFCKGVKA